LNIQESGSCKTESASHDEIEREVLAPIFRRSMFWTPERHAPSAWIEHVPFAFWLVDVLRPRRIVELGTHNGVSYSAMCQAVKSLGLATSCFAIDTWKGDEHAGFYGEDVYRDFAAFHDQRYGAFSQLVRSSFDQALRHFAEASIDLLHIDGLHTYEAVQHDYESWLPKLSAHAVVLFHDTNVRERDFGVFRLWEEIATGKPHFNFLHEHGLGVLGQGRDYPAAIRFLFSADEDGRLVSAIRETFGTLGRSVRALSERPGLDRSLSDHTSEISRLRQTLVASEDELATLRQGLSESTGEIDALRQTLAVREEELAGLERGFAASATAQEHELTAVKQALAERTCETGVLRKAVAAREAQVSSLNSTISALRASTSWRITAPLRAARRLSGRFLYSNLGYPFVLAWHALTTRSRAPLRNWRAERIIARSPLLDKDWYLANNPDVREWGLNPLRHYVAFGANEGRDPSPFFSTHRYLRDNADVAAAGINPLAHFVLYGIAEGRAGGTGLLARGLPLNTRRPVAADKRPNLLGTLKRYVFRAGRESSL
jgi:hypothetical protein